jgi:hypothetical protein
VGLRTLVRYVRSKVCASVCCASEKGKPIVRGGAKPKGLLDECCMD